MNQAQLLLLLLLAIALLLFIWGRWRYDVVSVVILIASVILGLVDSADAFSGFGHPAVVTVAAVLMISRAIQSSGVLIPLNRLFNHLPHHLPLQLLILTLAISVASAFMNNVGALALMLPIIIRISESHGHAPYLLFMPIAFASLLGGMTTLIGTPPNIIISGYLSEQGYPGFSMFDFTPVGIVIVLLGILFMAFIGWRFIPQRRECLDMTGTSQVNDYISSLKLPRGNQFAGKELTELEALGEGDFSVVAIIRRKKRISAPPSDTLLRAGDLLLIESDPESLSHLISQTQLKLVASPAVNPQISGDNNTMLAEALVRQGSSLSGRTAGQLKIHARFGVNLLGISRQGRPVRNHIGHITIRNGDLLLLQGSPDKLAEAISGLDCLSLGHLDIRPGAKIDWRPLLIFILAIIFAISGVMSIPIAFISAVTVMVLSGSLHSRDLYSSIEWPIILLLGALMPLGVAMAESGTATILATSISSLPAETPLPLILLLLMVITTLLSNVINNAASALLMAPIAMEMATNLGVSPLPLLMGVAIASSAAFLTPIGHQSNLLVMGPGGYQFQDYWRLGLPLTVLVIGIATWLIPIFWPFALIQ